MGRDLLISSCKVVVSKIRSLFLRSIYLAAMLLTAAVSTHESALAEGKFNLCLGKKLIKISSKSSARDLKSLSIASKKGKLFLPLVTTSNGKKVNRSVSCTRSGALSKKISFIEVPELQSLDLSRLLEQLTGIVAELSKVTVDTPNPGKPIPDSRFTRIANVFPPAPSEEQPTNFPRVVSALLRSQRFKSLGDSWTYGINSNLVIAISKHVDLYTVGGDVGTRLRNLSFDSLPAGLNTLVESAATVSSAQVNLSQTATGQNYIDSTKITSRGVSISFDKDGFITMSDKGISKRISLSNIHEEENNWISAGNDANFFSLGTSKNLGDYTWRQVSLPVTGQVIGIIVNPLGGRSKLGNFEAAFIDFQASNNQLNRLVNPMEYYFGTRSDSELGIERLDLSIAFPYGIRLRALSPLGQLIRVFYSGIFGDLISLPLVQGNPPEINEWVAQSFVYQG